MLRGLLTGWREKALWAGAAISCSGVGLALADRSTTREFTIACLAAFSFTTTALQVSWVSKRIDRLYRAEAQARCAEMAAMKRRIDRMTGPQLCLVEDLIPVQDRTLP